MKSWQRRLAVATATVGIASTISGGLFQSQDAQFARERQTGQVQQLRGEELRRHSLEVGDADHLDRLRPSEHRPPENLARDVAHSLLRRP